VHRRRHRPLFVTLFQTRYCSADKCTNGPRQERSRVPGTKVPGNESSMERTVQETNVPRNEWSRERKFHHGNECSRERIVLGTNIPDTSTLTSTSKTWPRPRRMVSLNIIGSWFLKGNTTLKNIILNEELCLLKSYILHESDNLAETRKMYDDKNYIRQYDHTNLV